MQPGTREGGFRDRGIVINMKVWTRVELAQGAALEDK